jgi:hypothetical protein
MFRQLATLARFDSNPQWFLARFWVGFCWTLEEVGRKPGATGGEAIGQDTGRGSIWRQVVTFSDRRRLGRLAGLGFGVHNCGHFGGERLHEPGGGGRLCLAQFSGSSFGRKVNHG